MSRPWRQTLLIILVALLAGMAGTWLGPRILPAANGSGASLHASVHRDLDLSPAQTAQIEALERDFAVRRQALELEMRQANAELAAAIASEGAYGPKVTAAVDHFHGAMGELQKATIEHVFAMRAVLTPAQAARFDRTVVDTLTADPK
ncbi:Spy/CpxP family protein refolding chaperone [Sandaracinobacteroides hominis]|uniref:Spy/CpxP family protein refolding chaperone n=1 Tax=Sandaracinobacteroides hominis TaxID=2780086 RepID=UPI000DAFE1F4|nr:periplasmic heavy metal sensor [Sandaracinobacteroides hominis]PZU44482.1 MAG: heavy metal resistance protein [Sphingomonas sp.]